MKDEALRLALEALYGFIPYLPLEHDKPQCDRYDQAITAIKSALEAKDEPVAWLHRFIEGGISIGLKPLDLERHPERWEPLYTTPPQQELVCVCGAVWEGQELVETPPQRTWVGLTYEDMVALQKDLYNAKGESVLPTTFAMAVEAKLKEKNT
jgi:hypothetical protein